MDSSQKTKPSGILSNTISLSMVSVITMALALAGTILVTRHYTVNDYGVYTLIIIISAFLLQCSNFGLDLSIPKFLTGSDDKQNREKYFSTAVAIRVLAIIITSFLAWFGRPLFDLLFHQSLLPVFFLYVPLLFSADSMSNLLNSTLQGCFLFSKIALVNTISSITFLVLIIILCAMNGDIHLLILARVFSSLLASVIAFILIPIKKRFIFDAAIFKELIKFGYPLQINGILTFIFNRIDSLAIAVYLQPADLAMYEVARKIPEALRSFYDPFKSVYFPNFSKRFTQDGPRQAAELLNEALRIVAFITLLAVMFTILFGREILELVFTEKYSSAYPIFVLFMVNLSIALISNVMGTTLVAVGDTKKPPVINTINAVISWIGTVVLIPLIGLVGATIGNMIGTLAALPLNRYFVHKSVHVNFSKYLKPIILTCIWCVFVIIIKPDNLLLKIGLFAGFIVSAFLFSIITKMDVGLLFESIGIYSIIPMKNIRLWLSKP